jgi:hypothetical protein
MGRGWGWGWREREREIVHTLQKFRLFIFLKKLWKQFSGFMYNDDYITFDVYSLDLAQNSWSTPPYNFPPYFSYLKILEVALSVELNINEFCARRLF